MDEAGGEGSLVRRQQIDYAVGWLQFMLKVLHVGRLQAHYHHIAPRCE